MSKPSDKFMRLKKARHNHEIDPTKHTPLDFLDRGPLFISASNVLGWSENHVELRFSQDHYVKETAAEIETEYNRVMEECEKDE